MNDNPFQGPGDKDLKKIMGPDPKESDAKKPDPKPKASDEAIVNAKGGGGAAAKQTQADRELTAAMALAAQDTPPTAAMIKANTPGPDALEVKAKADTAVISDPKWPEPETLFHQEVEVSVKLTTPPGKEHITKVQGELFAKTATGKESLSKSEGHAQADGTVMIPFPVYKPKGHEDGIAELFIEFTHKLAKMLSTINAPRPVSGTALKSADHILIPGTTFDKDTSFIGPKGTQCFKPLEARFNEWEQKFPKKAQIAVFGHTDKGEKDAKGLSERRAQSAFAFITNDAATWDNLYRAEQWGLKALQTLLKDLGHYHGGIDGEDGPNTQAAFKAFQKGAGLPESGREDSTTRKALFGAYMKGKHDIKIDASRFCQVAGNPWMGCAANNQIKESAEAAPENRRVAFILVNPNKHFPLNFPCQDGSEAACLGQCKKAGKRSVPGTKCLFYDEMVREEKQEAAKEEVPASESQKHQQPNNGFDIDKAVAYLESNLFPESKGECAKHVRLAILAGGVNIYPNPVPAKDYDSYLIKHGFTEISKEDYTPVKGDIAVIQPYPGGKPYGHICMFGGEIWLSDFAQRDMWSGPQYREQKPSHKLFRWEKK